MDYGRIVTNCLKKGVLYEDPDFPADNSSLFYGSKDHSEVKWLRPHEIAAKNGTKPKFTEDGFSRFDLEQGQLGDCWVVAALASLSERPVLLQRVVPRGQNFDSPRYCGVFRFNFYRFGEWVEVCIDDRLPSHHHHGQLVYTSSSQSNEFWGALLEKAYAKLAGCYEALTGGRIMEALEDFSGGIIEEFEFPKEEDAPSNLKDIIFKGFERNSCFGASAHDALGVPFESSGVLKNGLVLSHAYTITDIRTFERKSNRGRREITLIRLRNPWGDRTEWNGAWSDHSSEWNSIDESNRRKVGLVKKHDGEFWMQWEEFLKRFDRLDACHLSPDDVDSAKYKQWIVHEFKGEWVKRESAGGQPYYQDTHWKNPMYIVRLEDSDEDDDHMATCIVSIGEKDLRNTGPDGKDKYLCKAVFIYKLDEKYGKFLRYGQSAEMDLDKDFFRYNRSIANSTFVSSRVNVQRFNLEPGLYLFVACTYEPDEAGKFMLRIFTEKPSDAAVRPRLRRQ